MAKEMLINVSAGEECRIAVVEDGKLEELYMERTSSATHVGNVYKGKVTNVEASIQAAFIDFGIGRNGFLHVSDLMPAYWNGGRGDGVKESVGRKLGRRDRPPIQQCLRRGDEIIVQVIKEGLGTKGPTLSSYLSIPGRILVMMPGVGKSGVSKKIEDEDERRRLRAILDKLNPPKDAGFIIRTAGVGRSEQEIERDFKYLMRLWEEIEKADTKKAPLELYAEGDLVMRTVRDVYTSDIESIIVDDKDTAKRIKEFFKLLMPRTKNKVEVYEDTVPLFHEYKVERDIEMMNSRTVPLPSGGSLVIDQTEAVVAIDVNSGKSRQSSDAETSAFRTDMEAADEIPRQLKLRDLGGVVICDFIDLRFDRHRRELEARLDENLKKDRAKTRFLQMSEFGIVEMTRQRMRPSLKKSVFQDCPHCHGQGLVKSVESMGLDVVRKLAIAAHDDRIKRVTLSLHPDIAVEVLNRKRAAIAELEEHTGKRLVVQIDSDIAQDEMHFELFDEREGLVFLPELGMEAPQGGGRSMQGGRREERGNRRGGQNQGRRNERDDDREELEERDSGHGHSHGSRELEDDEETDRGGDREELRRDGSRREEPRGDQQRGDQQRRDEPRRNDQRRDESRRGEPRRDEPRRDEQRPAARQQQPQRPAMRGVEEDVEVEEEIGHGEAERDTEPNVGGGALEGGVAVEHGDFAGEDGPSAGPTDGDEEGIAVDSGQHGGGLEVGHDGGYPVGDQQGEGGGRRRRRRRRGRRGRGGQGGDQQQVGQNFGEQPRPDEQRPPRPESYSNDPGVEVSDDDGPSDNRNQGQRNDGRNDRNGDRNADRGPRDNRGQHGGGHQQNHQQGGRRDERGNGQRFDNRGGQNRGGQNDRFGGQDRNQGRGQGGGFGGQNRPNRFGPVGDRQPMLPLPPKPVIHDEDPEMPGPGNSIHEPEPVRESPKIAGGRRGRRGRGRGPTPAEKTMARIPVPTSDSLVARFLEQPIDEVETMDKDDNAGNRAVAPAPKLETPPPAPRGRASKAKPVEEAPAPVEAEATEPAEDEAAAAKPKGRRRAAAPAGRGKSAKAAKGDKPSGRTAAAAALKAVPKTGSTDAHAVDEGETDLSQFLKPATPADLDYLPEYEDDE